jgi:prevent-host-death family protein
MEGAHLAGAIIPTQRMKFTEARPQLSNLLNRVYDREMRVMISKGNIPVAAIVSIDDLERLNQLDAQRDADFAVLDEIGAAFADQTPEEIEENVDRIVAEVRKEMRRERQVGKGS